MRRALVFVLLLAARCCAQIVPAASMNPAVRTNAVLYKCTGIPSGSRTQSMAWLFGILDSVGSCAGIGDLSGNMHAGTDQTWSVYLDSGQEIPTFEWSMRPNAYVGAGSVERNAEDLLAHSTVDYDVQNSSTHVRVPNSGWVGVDEFGFGEENSKGDGDTADGVNSRNGVLLYNGSTYTDVTVNAYCNGQSTSVDPCKNNTATAVSMSGSNNVIFVGYDPGPFDTINFTFTSIQIGGTTAYAYWNGVSWGSLTVTDGTVSAGQAFGQNGAVTFTPPLDWARHSITGTGVTTTGAPNPGANTTQAKFLVRITIGGSPSQYATFANINGDNWLSASITTYCAWQQDGSTTSACWRRGWRFSTCSAGAETMNNGAQYCPSPNANSSARFEYQGRMPVYISERNRVYPNVSAMASDGTLLWAWAQSGAIVNAKIVTAQNYSGVNGVFNDNNGIWPSPAGSNTIVPPFNDGEYTDYACATWPPTNSCTDNTFYGYWAAADAQERANNHTNYGSGFATIGNVTPGYNTALAAPNFLTVCAGLDQCVWEGFAEPFNWTQNNLANWQAFATTSNFPFGTMPMLMAGDTYWSTPRPNGTQAHVFGFGNRSPMVEMASYLIFTPWSGGVNYGVFSYDKAGDYSANNDVQVWADASSTSANSTLSAPLAAGSCTSGAPCDIYLTADDQVAGNGGTYYATLPVFEICPGTTEASCGDEGDVEIVTKVGTGHYQAGTGSGPGTEYIAGIGASHTAYAAGSFVRYATEAYQGVGSPYSAPRWFNVRYWAAAFPAMAVDYGAPDASGYNSGAPNQAWLTNNAASSLGNCTTGGGTTTGCDPIARRSYRNSNGPVEVLSKTHGNSQDAELDTYSPEIDLPTLSPACSGNCVYEQVYTDGTFSAASNTVGLCPAHPVDIGKLCLRGAEAAILVPVPALGPSHKPIFNQVTVNHVQ